MSEARDSDPDPLLSLLRPTHHHHLGRPIVLREKSVERGRSLLLPLMSTGTPIDKELGAESGNENYESPRSHL